MYFGTSVKSSQRKHVVESKLYKLVAH